MKKILYVCFTLILSALFISCSRQVLEPVEYEDLKYVADNYTLEDAKREGYVIIEELRVTYGEDTWQTFFDMTKDKIPCKVRVAHYYTIGDKIQYEPEYYETIKDEYPKIYILELVYDGETYSVSHYEEERLYQNEFKYLMKYEGKAETACARYDSYVRYVLVDDDSLTWEDIMRGLLSSHSGAYIPHRQIYTNLIYKEDNQ